jgi:wyosine [tRNA(Phe)-imidazoG37] synthetase (radical SAM superfamily)
MARIGMRHMPEGYKHIFGPVISRRLGISLGVDMVPPKTCTYDCLYCEVGPTTTHTVEPRYYFSAEQIIGDILNFTKKFKPDFITFGGSGEPTLNLNLGPILKELKPKVDCNLALLTNGSLLYLEEIRTAVMGFDVVIPTFSTNEFSTYQRLHRPHRELRLELLKKGLRALRKDFKGEIWVEVMLVRGLNDNEDEWMGIKGFLEELRPQRVQLGTVERPPAHVCARPVSYECLIRAKEVLGEKVELIGVHAPSKATTGIELEMVLNTLRRRPLKVEEISHSLGIRPWMSEEERSSIEDALGVKRVRQGDRDFYVLKSS